MPSCFYQGPTGRAVPFFSSDSQWVGFSVGTQLKKVSISGGAPTALCDTEATPQGASWSGDTIVFSAFQQGVYRISSNGGTPELIADYDVLGIDSAVPQLLPGREALLLSVNPASGNRVLAYVFRTGETRLLIEGGSTARYVDTGHLIYGLEGSLLAVPFDSQGLQLTGGSVPLVDDVSMRGGIAQYDVSETGSLAYYVLGEPRANRTLVWVDSDGVARPISEEPRRYGRPRLSPDGRRLAVQIRDDAWVMELDRTNLRRLTFGGGTRPIWGADGTSVFFATNTSPEVFEIFSTPADGSGPAQQITEGGYRIPDSVSPDGKILVVRQHRGATGRDIGLVPLDGSSDPEILLGSPYDEMHGIVSPNGRWIAYSSDESGAREVYVQSFPELGGKKMISADGGTEPQWSRDGNELFYRNGDTMMAVTVSPDSGLEPSRPVKLFEGSYATITNGVSHNYDVAPDGRFLMVRREEGAGDSEQEINVVLNWFEELKARVPTE